MQNVSNTAAQASQLPREYVYKRQIDAKIPVAKKLSANYVYPCHIEKAAV